MGFKAKLYKFDLTMDLTNTGIPASEAVFSPSKPITPALVTEWLKDIDMFTKKVDVDENRKRIIDKIDFFYDKGFEFWDVLHLPVLRDILEYITNTLVAAEKK